MIWARAYTLVFLTALLAACASKVLEYDKDKAAAALKNEEYDKNIQVTAVGSNEPVPEVKPDEPAHGKKKKKKGKKKSSKTAGPSAAVAKKTGPHQPDIEDSEGFVARRPVVDPFRIGEKVTLNISYFNVVAGSIDIRVKPMVEVNGEKAYHFEVAAKSNSLFSHIYGVDDLATTYVSYDDMIPLNLQITLKESKQLAEARTFIDWKNLKASYWQKRVTKEHGEESKKIEWKILPFSQNVISAAFYMRTFKYEVGKKLAFRVVDEGKNIVFTGEVLRKEKLQTDVGLLDTIVMKPHVTVDGVFTPVGEILVWLTDDDRKFIVRLETKIKIGTIVAKIGALDKGQEKAP